jgi:hypothetical protein
MWAVAFDAGMKTPFNGRPNAIWRPQGLDAGEDQPFALLNALSAGIRLVNARAIFETPITWPVRTLHADIIDSYIGF